MSGSEKKGGKNCKSVSLEKKGILESFLTSGVSRSRNGIVAIMEEFVADFSDNERTVKDIVAKDVSKYDEFDIEVWCSLINITSDELKQAIGIPRDIKLDAETLTLLEDEKVKFGDERKDLTFQLQIAYLKILYDQDEKIKVMFVNFINNAVNSYLKMKESNSPSRLLSDLYILFLRSKRNFRGEVERMD